MRSDLARVNGQQRKSWNYIAAGRRGAIPWTASGLANCYAHINNTYLRLAAEERKDWDPYVEAILFIKPRYGRSLGTAHAIRMGAVLSFLYERDAALRKDQIIRPSTGDLEEWDISLFEALAKLPFSTRRGFGYQRVKAYIRSSRSPS
jgi:hypothetical protein